MNSVYEDILISKLLSLSVSKDIEIAKTEWIFNGEVIDNGPIKDQMKKAYCGLCEHPIRYEYILTNTKNNRKIGIGSECIGNYSNVHYSKIEGSLKKLKHDQYKKVYDSYRKADWSISNLKMYLRCEIEKIGGILGWSYPENKQMKIDYECLNTNNEICIYRLIQSGTAVNIANKYGFKLRMDYLQDFLTVYPGAKKDKAGFLKR